MFFRTFGNRLRHAGMDFSNTIRSKLLPALAAFALFFVVSAAYFAPQFRGEALPQHDVIQYEGMAKDISDMRAATGEDPQWTGGMFGGMPAYLINVAYPAQLVKRTVGQVVKIIDTPAGFLFFAMVSMWLMLLIVGINPWVGIVAALAYGLSTYFLLIIGAGHVTKMWALVYAPLMMGGAWMTLRGNVWCGAALTGLAASLEIGANHPQITYYFLVAMAAFWISEGILSFREGRLRDFSLRTAALVVVQWAVPLLGALALMRLWKGEIPRERLLRALAWAAGITGGACLLLAVAGGSLFDFGRAESADYMTDTFRHIFESNNMRSYIDRGMDIEWAEATADAMAADRAAMMRADAWRSLVMILLAAGGVALFALRRINRYVLTGLLAGVMLLDLVPVDLRFLSSENFVSPRRNQVTASAADKAIMQDKDPGYRVLNLTVSPFNDATTSYFHRSVGGYHGAKLARYQDLIDRYLSNADDGVLDMLNTRYLIVPGKEGQPEAQRRTTAFGAAWFVDSVIYAPSAQAEIDLLGKTDLRTTAVVSGQNPAKSASRPMPLGIYASARIELTEYRPNYLKYEYTLPEEAVAVFSEIFYDQGWKAYVDGEESPYFRADYVLRAMTLPAGTHTVEWRFRAPGWTAVEGVTLAASLAILLGAVAALAYCFRKRTEKEK